MQCFRVIFICVDFPIVGEAKRWQNANGLLSTTKWIIPQQLNLQKLANLKAV